MDCLKKYLVYFLIIIMFSRVDVRDEQSIELYNFHYRKINGKMKGCPLSIV